VPTRGELRLLVVLADFPDRSLAEPRSHFAGAPDALVDRLVAYYDEVSTGRLRIVPIIGGPVVTLPLPRAQYVQHPDTLAGDALRAFGEAAVDPADRAALREASALVVFFAGTGRESHAGDDTADDPWSNYTPLPALRPTPQARVFEDACVIAEDEVPPLGSFGVLCHEFGHLLGLPELYAPGDHPQEGVGVWDLMGEGTWLGQGEHPAQLSAWSKLQLGWVDVETIEATSVGVTLPAIERTPRVLRIPAVADHPEEYYLLENRQRLGADGSLPGEGLLIWHVDDRVAGFRTAETDVAHQRLHLVEADGRGDLDRGHAAGGNRGDGGDPWRGPRWWRRPASAALTFVGALLVAAAVLRAVRDRPHRALGRLAGGAMLLVAARVLGRAPVCGVATPGMMPYDGGPVRVTIRNISPSGPSMRFDVLIARFDSGREGVTR